jgi:hypothetical protein
MEDTYAIQLVRAVKELAAYLEAIRRELEELKIAVRHTQNR